MDIKEALTFLELSSTATEEEIKQRLTDKLAYFENLSENSQSDFLRRVNAIHASRVKKMHVEFQSLKYKISETKSLPPEQPVQPPDVNVASDDETATAELKTREPTAKEKLNDEPSGWLILHTENMSAQAFPLFKGKIYIGRKQKPGFTPFITVEDVFVSRVHAVFFVEAEDPFDFYIEDTDDANGGKASTNGTYLNGNTNRISQKTKLHDDDTIQVGVTKFVLRLNSSTIENILEEVRAKDYMRSVAIRH